MTSSSSPANIEWFRVLLEQSQGKENRDPVPILAWLEARRQAAPFSSELIPLSQVQGWQQDPETGNIAHETGAFFSIEGARTTAADLREVSSWDQPIYNQKEGGILAMVCKQQEEVMMFLLQAKAEPGNIGGLQLCPSVQCTWSNLHQAHKGKRPPLAEIVLGEVEAKVVYKALHNEEGGRFWQKSNSNQIYLIDPVKAPIDDDSDKFVWATLPQIKALSLVDNVLSPFVKTIIAPL